MLFIFLWLLQLGDYSFYANFVNAVEADTWINLPQSVLQALHLLN